MKFEFIQTNKGQEREVKHGRFGRQRTKLKAFDVYAEADGQRVQIGRVEQGMATFERKPAGSRIVSSRWQSPRWFAHSEHIGNPYRHPYETRKAAAEALSIILARMSAEAERVS